MPIFMELEKLRSQAVIDCEKEELRFALALVKENSMQRCMKDIIRQVTAKLPNNEFVQNQPNIINVVKKTREYAQVGLAFLRF